MDKKITILEEIIGEVAVALYQRWYNASPTDLTESQQKEIQKNAQETTLFVIQMFMDKFNAAAEELKNQA